MCGIWALISKEKIGSFGDYYELFMKIKHRGPEYSSFDLIHENALLGFHRLAINDPTPDGNQPFHHCPVLKKSTFYCICNGEIYDHDLLVASYGLHESNEKTSDCEVILPIYENRKRRPEEFCRDLGSEFALVILEIESFEITNIFAARDPIGVRPLFWHFDGTTIVFSSEMKGLPKNQHNTKVFPPGHFMSWDPRTDSLPTFKHYCRTAHPVCIPSHDGHIKAMNQIKGHLIEAVRKRIGSTDRQLGCLLSGGLDSSLIVGITRHLLKKSFPVYTISLKGGGTDLIYAEKVANALGLEHHIVEIDVNDALSEIENTIYTIESYDITTVRASVMQKILAKYIQEKTPDVKVILTGENSDELFMGYLYYHCAPCLSEAGEDSKRLVRDVHRFDGLRTDRTTAAHGLEVRVPFADCDLVDLVQSLDPGFITPKKQEKYILRDAFKEMNLIPEEVLWRRKEAFSDAVSTSEDSWYRSIQTYVDSFISDEEFQKNRIRWKINTPFTKEAYYYRKIFVKYFGDSDDVAETIPYFWMPRWQSSSEQKMDPSARTLKIY